MYPLASASFTQITSLSNLYIKKKNILPHTAVRLALYLASSFRYHWQYYPSTHGITQRGVRIEIHPDALERSHSRPFNICYVAGSEHKERIEDDESSHGSVSGAAYGYGSRRILIQILALRGDACEAPAFLVY